MNIGKRRKENEWFLKVWNFVAGLSGGTQGKGSKDTPLPQVPILQGDAETARRKENIPLTVPAAIVNSRCIHGKHVAVFAISSNALKEQA